LLHTLHPAPAAGPLPACSRLRQRGRPVDNVPEEHIGIDSRLLRYSKALQSRNIPHAAAFWARGNSPAAELGFPQFPFSSRPQSGRRWHLALHLLRANIFFMATLWKHRSRISLVHAVDLDTAVSAWIARRLIGLPYVNYADSRMIGGRMRRLLAMLEAMLVRDAAFVILADEARKDQHQRLPDDRVLVVENVPVAGRVEARARAAPLSRPDRLRIGYLGTFEPRARGLEDLIAAVEGNSAVELHIAGSGLLREAVAASARRCDRIILHPPLGHEDGLALMSECDIIVGLYYSFVPNHRYAAPNKYYEHLLTGRPLLTSKGTPPGSKVEQHDTGWAIEDGQAPIAEFLARVVANPAELKRKASRAAALWQRCFADHFERKLRGDYVAWVRRAGRRCAG
jgi:glycosyltransferase involved in cell wall biosynthesis